MTNVPEGWLMTLESVQIPYEDAATEDQAIRPAEERVGVRVRGSGASLIVDWEDPPDVYLEEADASQPKHWLVAFSSYIAPPEGRR